MSSVDFKKCHVGGEGAAMISHAMRHPGKTDVAYSNPDIYPELSTTNSEVSNWDNIGADPFEPAETSQEMYSMLKKVVGEIDAILPPKRVKSDRVNMISYTIAAPEGLPPEKEAAFFKIAHDEIAKFSGGHNHVTPGWIHRDEIHPYIDPLTGQQKMSKAHMHMAGVPFVEGKGVNGKLFETRGRMKQLNQNIDKRCQAELGIKFMTGKALKPHEKGRRVEDMKRHTDTMDRYASEELKASERLEKASQTLESIQGSINNLEQQKKLLEANIEALRAEEQARIDKKLHREAINRKKAQDIKNSLQL